MALILNIETATDICSVCIAKGTEVLSIQESTDAYSHSAALTLFIEACRKNAGIELKDLDAIAISAGPGSYTALRVGASVAKGICYALDKPMIAINTLQSLAFAAKQVQSKGAYYIPMIDARRMEVYAEIYDAELNLIEETNNVILDEKSFDAYFEKGGPIVFSGNGVPKSKDLFESKAALFCDLVCSAHNLVPLSLDAFQKQSFVDIAYYSPMYFKAPNITVPKKIL